MSRPRLFTFTLMLLPLLSANAKLNQHNYYPQKLIKVTEQETINKGELKEHLYNVLSKVHMKTSGEDKIVEQCPLEESCYSQLKTLSYREARQILFGQLHLEQTNQGPIVRDVYCNNDYNSSHGVGKNQIPNHKFINCEHTWPQSKFNSRMDKNLQKTDLHHLYPVMSRANSTRSNKIFGEISNGTVVNSQCKDSRKGTIDGTRISGYEPPIEHRGNVARALFYFSVRYKTTITDVEEEFLRKWHKEDPVDEAERIRNQRIYEIQRNRNPFIDDPQLVNQIKDF
ncbi:endonuclease [Halobacteriovorax sp. GB3]|uniref:endonuclease I family protein n=1 Tax=Halobacteriovorax sp. GB3 TaxID=2719615 RepID=UPI0023607CE1|nr:endonuclease [Halobacteriovorax sp. GB3]MDD0853463.1 endonuclease [Halobacteriovorax sp. GB3]